MFSTSAAIEANVTEDFDLVTLLLLLLLLLLASSEMLRFWVLLIRLTLFLFWLMAIANCSHIREVLGQEIFLKKEKNSN